MREFVQILSFKTIETKQHYLISLKDNLKFNFIISFVFTDLVSMKKIDLFIEVEVTKMADKTNSSLHVV